MIASILPKILQLRQFDEFVFESTSAIRSMELTKKILLWSQRNHTTNLQVFFKQKLLLIISIMMTM